MRKNHQPALEQAEITQLSNSKGSDALMAKALEQAEITQLSNHQSTSPSCSHALEQAEITQLSNALQARRIAPVL